MASGSPSEGAESPQEATRDDPRGTGGGEPQAAPERLSWWRRMFGS